jgi:ABC-type lipoprotein release transport system permease subunit
VLANWVVIGGLTLRLVLFVAAYAAAMAAVCMLACVVPTRRALRVEPVHALRADG